MEDGKYNKQCSPLLWERTTATKKKQLKKMSLSTKLL